MVKTRLNHSIYLLIKFQIIIEPDKFLTHVVVYGDKDASSRSCT